MYLVQDQLILLLRQYKEFMYIGRNVSTILRLRNDRTTMQKHSRCSGTRKPTADMENLLSVSSGNPFGYSKTWHRSG